MSANHLNLKAADLWKVFPDNARVGFFLISVVIILRLPLAESLWLDEALTAWVTKDTLLATIDRAINFQGQSPLYFILVWLIQFLLGSGEFALRSLSWLGISGAVFFLFLVARRVAGVSFAWLACSLFITQDAVQVAAVSARPYALGLMFSIASVWALIRWEEDGRYRYSILYLTCYLLSVYFQYLFAFMLVVHIAHLALYFKSQRVPLMSLATELCLVAALLFPAFLHMAELGGKQEVLQFVPEPDIARLFSAIFPPVYAVAFLVASLFALFVSTDRRFESKIPAKLLIWLGFWFVAPPTFFFLVSKFGGISIFLERYFLFYSAGMGLFLSGLSMSWRAERTRAIFVVALLGILFIREFDRRWMLEDWRGAAKILNQASSNSLVMVYPGLAEARHLAWLQDSKKQEYLLAPMLYYGVSQPMVILPSPDLKVSSDSDAGIPSSGQLFNLAATAYLVGLDQHISSGTTMSGWVKRFEEQGVLVRERRWSGNSLVKVFELKRPHKTHDTPSTSAIDPNGAAEHTAPPNPKGPDV